VKSMKLLLLPLLLAAPALAQDPAPADVPKPVTPAGILATVNYNQLGTPRVTGGFGAFYSLVNSVGVYGVSGAEFYTKLAVDPGTGRNFYALVANAAQEVHKHLLDVGSCSIYAGGGGGPSLSSSPQSSGVTVAFSANGSTTAVCPIKSGFGFVFSVKEMYINGIGWNLIPRIGFKFDLKKPAK